MHEHLIKSPRNVAVDMKCTWEIIKSISRQRCPVCPVPSPFYTSIYTTRIQWLSEEWILCSTHPHWSHMHLHVEYIAENRDKNLIITSQ